MTWNPDDYEQFAELRAQPFWDLVGMLQPPEAHDDGSGPDVVDLGCGTGALTAALADRLGARSVLGIDSSPEMLARAETRANDGVRFEQGDLSTFDRPSNFDVVVSNAALHWLDDHRNALGRFARALRPGGQLAVQLPANFGHPSHTVAAKVAADSYFDRRWIGTGRPRDRGEVVLPPAAYAQLLDDLDFEEQSVQLRVYPMRLASSDLVVDWVRGTLLVPYRAALDPEDYAEFERRYATELAHVIGRREPYFYGFDRILMWGRRGR